MPQAKNAPRKLNSELEDVYLNAMKQYRSKKTAGKVARSAAKKHGWHKDKRGNWTKD